MKEKILFLLVMLSTAVSCYNDDITFEDYSQQSVYFPYQYPVRTLSLGNDKIDNSLDKMHRFHIGVCVGGYYQTNKQDWKVDFEIVPDMVGTNLYNADGNQLKVMPEEYYELAPENSVVIPEGSFSGLVQVQMKDAFFSDPEAIKGTYVIPLRITAVQSPAVILAGNSKDVEKPDPHNAEHWNVLPMDYTLFGVKYINRFHGNWLRRGAQTVRTPEGSVVSVHNYRAEYVEYDELVSLSTTSMDSFSARLNIKDEEWIIDVVADENNALTVKSAEKSKIKIKYGTGSFREGAESWGGTADTATPRDAVYMNYFYERSDGNICEICDTLVFRDRGIKLEVQRPVIK